MTTTGGFWDKPGDLQGGPEEIAWYTHTFSGTSSASPIVVGALAALQGMLKTAGQEPMSPDRARAVLRATGSPQQDAPGRPASQRIGNRPDIKAAVTHLVPHAVGSVAQPQSSVPGDPPGGPHRLRGRTARCPSVVLGRRDRRPGHHRLTQPITSREGDTRMSTTPQMSHMGQQQGQQFPSTSPYQQQQNYGQQQPYGMSGSLEQLQQLGQQQPFQQLLQQLGQPLGGQQQGQQDQQAEQQMQQQLQQVALAAVQQVVQEVQAQALASGVANGFIDIVHPLQGQPHQIFLRITNQFRVLNNPNPQVHQQIQQAFAFGHQVIGIWDTQSPSVLRSVRIQRI
ncbi:hypothetical protein QQM39_36725 [Streptomyces sp. DT2A-34]|uniref:hypothetical protein n=1 Tax=Streptomyces sp. DT2A-34 TaxID=3051182 RepID=UPI00265B77C3|nr:hypothetical protein [Streptomyces sp. DT2A-34]MDO0916177.1 hypothetical protein [Streptomyces sp. DT2A-34]